MSLTTVHTCYTLKMARFIEYRFDEKPKPENWEDIYNEYISLRENKRSSFIPNMIKEITFLKTKYFIINKCVEILILHPVPELIQELKIQGYRGEYNWENKSTYTRDLQRAITGSKKLITQHQKYEAELEAYLKKYAGNGTTDKKEFYVWAVTLSEHNGYRIDFEAVSVAEWCVLLNQYESWCEIRNAQANNLLNKNKGYGAR